MNASTICESVQNSCDYSCEMELNERIRLARKEAELSQSELARRCGVDPSAINHLESGKTRSLSGALQTGIAAACNVSEAWLSNGRGNMHAKHYVMEAEGGQYQLTGGDVSMIITSSVPIISLVQAGNWADVIDDLAPGDGDRIATTYRAKAHTYALRVTGDSMEPKFPSGSIIIVEPEEEPLPGKYVIVRQNGDSEATFKQLVQDGGTLLLKPLNDRYPIMTLRADAVFCGVVKRVEMDV